MTTPRLGSTRWRKMRTELEGLLADVADWHADMLIEIRDMQNSRGPKDFTRLLALFAESQAALAAAMNHNAQIIARYSPDDDPAEDDLRARVEQITDNMSVLGEAVTSLALQLQTITDRMPVAVVYPPSGNGGNGHLTTTNGHAHR